MGELQNIKIFLQIESEEVFVTKSRGGFRGGRRNAPPPPIF